MKIGIIGVGNMGSSILDGILEKKVIRKDNIFVFDIDKKKIRNLSVNILKSNREISEFSDIIIVAVKPKDAKNVFEEIKENLNSKKLIISIMAGIKIKNIEKIVGENIPIVRVMPNLNVKVKSGIIVYCYNKYGKKYEGFIKKIFLPIGIVIKMPEDKFDTITAICGSGPGFLFYIAEEFEKICIEKGISSQISNDLVSTLFFGTGKMLFETKIEPQKLKEMVSSPGGTTIAGLNIFEKEKFGYILRKAIEAAEERSKELSKD
ncbi:MAG: pyrroline-5-carboxylate reductase [bacterium]|nr:pyrroline-5-carboxylate reductase [bacterium]MDW8163433.1 pyrroline-5-carboxylate reductase [Candidatus Omnitrophota bacterium]